MGQDEPRIIILILSCICKARQWGIRVNTGIFALRHNQQKALSRIIYPMLMIVVQTNSYFRHGTGNLAVQKFRLEREEAVKKRGGTRIVIVKP